MRLVLFLDKGKYFFGVAFGGDFGEDVQQFLVGANDKSGALNATNFLAVHVLILHDTKLIANFLVYISKEWLGQIVFCAELRLGRGSVERDAEHNGTGVLQLFDGIV